jgi:translation elongation factor EF-1beta
LCRRSLDLVEGDNVHRLDIVLEAGDLVLKIVHHHLVVLNDTGDLEFLDAVANGDELASAPEEDAEAERIKAERIAAYNARKAAKEDKKGKVIAKSNIILDIKPWDDETPMADLEKSIRSIEMDGLLWGTGKFVAIGYGIKKLQITCVIQDDKVMMDDLEDKVTGFEDYVQSMDIVAFNKI